MNKLYDLDLFPVLIEQHRRAQAASGACRNKARSRRRRRELRLWLDAAAGAVATVAAIAVIYAAAIVGKAVFG